MFSRSSITSRWVPSISCGQLFNFFSWVANIRDFLMASKVIDFLNSGFHRTVSQQQKLKCSFWIFLLLRTLFIAVVKTICKIFRHELFKRTCSITFNFNLNIIQGDSILKSKHIKIIKYFFPSDNPLLQRYLLAFAFILC